jgi:hypothetical protein
MLIINLHFLFQGSVEPTVEVSKTFDEKIRKYCDVTLMSLAYAGTGNVLKVLYLQLYFIFLLETFQASSILKAQILFNA